MPSTRAAVKASTRAAVKALTRAAVEASTRIAGGVKGRRQRKREGDELLSEEPPTVEAARKLPRLKELWIFNEKMEKQIVLKDKDW